MGCASRLHTCELCEEGEAVVYVCVLEVVAILLIVDTIGIANPTRI